MRKLPWPTVINLIRILEIRVINDRAFDVLLQIIMIIMKSPNLEQFEAFIAKLQPQQFYKKAILHQSKFFDVTLHELLKLNPKQALHLREFIINKCRDEQDLKEKMKEDWVQPQKRFFTWVLLCYLELQHKTALALNQQDYQFLSDITTQKSIPLIKYIIHSLLQQEKRPLWTQQQDILLAKILAQDKKFSTVGEWSHVSKELFIRGDHIAYKSGKNCRERWFNYVNPQLSKEWTFEEDLKLFSFVRKEGKKWSRIIPELLHTKSEHMIKNRYNSLVKKMQSQTISRTKEAELVNLLIQKLTKQKQKKAQENKVINVANLAERSNKRLLRSASITSLQKQQQHKLEQGLLVSKDMEESIMQDNEDHNPQKFLIESNIKKEDKQQETDKYAFNFKLNQSMRFQMTSPLPITPYEFGGATPKADQFTPQFLFSRTANFVQKHQ